MVPFIYIFSIGSFIVLMYTYTRIPIKQFRPMVVATDEIAQNRTRFVYLMQTENCIPAYLKSPEVIGDSGACQCDVIVLSYKNECADTSLPHVQYIFNSSNSTTWTVGRNLLYKAAMKREKKYLYYIFMDDDLQLIKADEKNIQNPWRMSEESLNIFQPAVVFLLLKEETRTQSETLSKPLNCELTGYIQIYDMNAIFSAFHYQAIDHILPYTAKYDSVSWWFSQMYIIIKCNILFKNEAVIDSRIRVTNPQHRDYPRKHVDQNVINQKIIPDIRSETPEEYRKSVEPILQQWLTNRKAKKLLGRQTCKRNLFVHPYRPYENLAYIGTL